MKWKRIVEMLLSILWMLRKVRADCRRTCRRNFWIELFKSAAKIAGVVLAALGLSSFNEES